MVFTLLEVAVLDPCCWGAVDETIQLLYLYFEIELGPTLRNMIVGDDPTVLVASTVRLENSTAVFCHREEVWGAVCRTWNILVCADNHDWSGHSEGSQNTNVVNG